MMDLEIAHILHVSDKVVIARLSRTIWSVFSLFLIFCCCFTRLAKYEKLGKFWSYCTRNCEINIAYAFSIQIGLFYSLILLF